MLARRGFLLGLGATVAGGASSIVAGARAQFVQRPVRFIYPYAAGGAGDALVRVVSAKMGELLGVTTIVENKPGGAGRIGTKAALMAEPDGLNILFAPTAPIVLNPLLYPKLDYDPQTDAIPIARLVLYDSACVVSPKLNVSTLAELVSWIRAHPKEANCGLAGGGGLHHFFCMMFAKLNGLEITYVMYRGSGPVMNDLLGGQIPFSFAITSEAIALHEDAKVRILATSGRSRSPLLPDVPTFKEAGYDLQGEGWYGLFAPARTPQQKVDAFATAALEALRKPDVRQFALKTGYAPDGLGPMEFADAIKADLAQWGPVVRESGFKPSD